MKSMKSKVYQMIVKFTQSNLNSNANSVYISQQLNLSRNLVSQYLNELFNEYKLVKINTRPVIFFDVAEIEKSRNIKIEDFEFKSLLEFNKYLIPTEEKDFEKLIGYNESLNIVVNQCKAAISYPTNGLPILLYGPTGTGKSLMAQLMYEYGVNNKLIENDKKFLVVNCSEYANNPELFLANLFGYKKGAYTGADKDSNGIIKVAEGGVLFLDEIHCLKSECQEKLFLFMDKGIYHMLGDNEHWYKSNVRLIFATTEDPEKCLLKTLLRRIPIIANIPSLEDRGIHERAKLIYYVLKGEQERIGRNIFISNVVYNILLSTNFIGNIGDLKNSIQASCANSFLKSNMEREVLRIHAYDLPESLMSLSNVKKNIINFDNQSKMISIADLKKYSSNKRNQIKLNSEIMNYYMLIHNNKINYDCFLEKSFKSINKYYDYIIFKKRNVNEAKLDFIQEIIKNIFDIVSSKYEFKVSNNDIIAISSYINYYAKRNYEAVGCYDNYKTETEGFSKFLFKQLNREYLIALEIAENIKTNMDINLDSLIICILTLNLKMINKNVDINKRIGIIIAHGYSTASSIADSANKLLGQYVFDAMDMPLNVNTQTIIDNLNDYLIKRGNYEELILLVDMGSLEEIYKGVNVQKNSNMGVMNNITTKIALEIGNGIINNKSLKEIFQSVKKDSCINYKIINNKAKEKIILCCCASGIGTAEKLREIFIDSLPKNIPIKVLTYDYSSLIERRLNDDFFDRYDVLFIVGTLNPNIESVKFIPIENLIISEAFNDINECLKDYISEEDIRNFQKKVLKNFSLSNIINNLTILNPNKLLEHVTKSLDRLQNMLDIEFTNNTCYCLYVHICCLIERLVIGKNTDKYKEVNMSEMKESKLEFINNVKNAFSVVEKYYRVEIPIEEIGYIYEYVNDN